MSQNQTDINLNHLGDGDNVAGDKHVYNTAVSPEQVSALVEAAFDYLVLLELESAKKVLDNLRKLKETSLEVSESIELLDVFLQISLYQGNIQSLPEEYIDFIKKQFTKSGDNSSLASALLLKYLSLKTPEEALKVYNSIDDKGNKFIKFIFVQHIASKTDLQSYLDEYSTLSSTERYNLGFGIASRGSAEQASQLSELLTKEQESPQQIFFSFWLRQKGLFEKVSETPYLLLCYDDKNNVDTFVGQCEKVIEDGKGDWKFILNIVVPLFHYIGYDSKVFLEQCKNYQDDVKKNYPDVWCSIACSFDGFRVTAEDGLSFNIRQAREDENFKQERLKAIKVQEKWEIEDVDYVLAFDTPQIIPLDSIEIISEDDMLAAFTQLKVALLQIDEDASLEKREELLTTIRAQQETIKRLSPYLFPYLLLSICTALEQKREYELIQHLLQPLIVNRTDLWLSPITSLYLVALHQNNQYESFEEVKAQISEKEDKRLIYELESHRAFEAGKFNKASQLICEALKTDIQNLNAWVFFSRLVVQGYSNNNDEAIFDLLDKSFFLKIRKEHLIILVTMVKANRAKLAEEILIENFTQNQNPDYEIVPSFFGSLAMHSIEFSPSEMVNDCMGIEYKKSGKQYKSIIVPNTDANDYCLSKLEPHVSELVKLDANKQVFLSDNCDYELLEKLPPLIAINHICLEKIQKKGGKRLQVSIFDENDIETSMKRLSAMMRGHTESIKGIVANPEIPYSFKAGYLKEYDPVGTALGLLQDCDSASQLALLPIGIDEPKFVLDIHGCLYFSLLGLVDPLIQSTYQPCISPSTHALLTDWVSAIEENKDKGGGVGYSHGDKVGIQSNAEIFSSTSDLRKNLKNLLSYAEVIETQSVNFDELTNNLLTLDTLDISLTSSIKIAYSNSLPLFCLDAVLVGALQSELKIANSNLVLSALINSVTFKTRKYVLMMHSNYGLPVIFQHKDLYRLLLSKNIDDTFLVGSVIEKMEFQLETCRDIFCHSIDFLGIYFQQDYYKYCHSRIIYKILHKVISEKSIGQVAEERLANFVEETHTRLCFKESNVFEYFVRSFIQGHFLSIEGFNLYCNG